MEGRRMRGRSALPMRPLFLPRAATVRPLILLSRDISGKLDKSCFRDVAAALRAQRLDPVARPYDEARETQGAATLGAREAALLWVNPMQDGRDRRGLDALLRRERRQPA